jgi:acetyl/propionyl-CoA carboxylase alpha subunit/acetyl-CoA carboxylase carboxyltransferase component
MGRVDRLGIVDHGETAVRVLNAVHGVAATDEHPAVTTVLVHTGTDRLPWFGREADEIVVVPAGRTAQEDAVVDALVAAEVDAAWLGHLAGVSRPALIERLVGHGIEVLGPSAAVVAAVSATGPPAPTIATGTRRRVEIDVLADEHGTVWAFTGRDVSVRHAGATLVAQSPCTLLGEAVRTRLRETALATVRDAGFRGAGVVTLLHDDHDVQLLGIDPVAAPDHATTEERTGVSILGWRVRIHRGEPLDADEPVGEGVALEARILAVDPANGFVPSPGRISLLSFPVGTGVRVDANRREGDPVEPGDPLIAVVTAWGPDRLTALERLRRALERTSIVVEGGATNRTFLLALLAHPDLRRGGVDDDWVDRLLATAPVTEADPVALLAAAVESYDADQTLAESAFHAGAARGRPELADETDRSVQLAYCGHVYDLEVHRTGPRRYAIGHGRDVADVLVDRLDAFERRVTCGGHRFRMVVSPTATGVRVELGAGMHLVDREDGMVVRSGWPALVVSCLVEPGREVDAGDPIVVLESMKMETTVTAPYAGVVTRVDVGPNAQVEAGAPLLRIRAHRRLGSPLPGAAVDLGRFVERVDPTRTPCERVYEALGNYLLGYDQSPSGLRRLLTSQRRLAEIAAPDDADLLACEDGLLDTYADLGALYRPQTEAEAEGLEPDPENTQEHLVAFAQWLDADQAGLPAAYRARLLRALGRYDVTSLDPTSDLRAALPRLFRSFDRLSELSPVVLAILQRRLDHRDRLARADDVDARARYDRLTRATQGRQQAVADLARDVRFHFFDEPPMQAASAELVAEMTGHLDALAADPDAPDRAERIARLVWCPHPMRGTLLDHWGRADQDPDATRRRRAVLELHVRRFYRIRTVGGIEHHLVDGLQFATAEYTVEGRDIALVVAYLPLDDLPRRSATIAGHLATIDPDRRAVIDVVAWHPGEIPDIATTAAIVRGLLDQCRFGRPIHRLDVTLTSSGGPAEERFRTQNVTFRQRPLDEPAGGEWYEEVLYRNLHPMLAKRLELWRLCEFDLERRPSPEDVYLFHGVARDNPADQRLFALAEVRELEPVPDPATGEVRYPRLERTGLLALAAMRTELARHPVRDRPVANRLVLDVRAAWTVPRAHVETLATRLAPLAARAGLEKVVLKVRIPDTSAREGVRDATLHFEQVGRAIVVREDRAGDQPVRPLGRYQQKVLTAARFGSPYPYEIARFLTRGPTRAGLPDDTFVELDLDGDELVPVDREPGLNRAHLVVGLITNHSEVVPEGMTRVALLSDPTQGLGNLAEPECRRINAALAYAARRRIPVEWFAVSSGALIAMDSGTENMDWIALTLRRLIEFTQAGGEVNIVVTGINVGGQPYWNAEATMLMHTRGILVMTPASAMVLTGKQALDFSGAVSAEDNFGIGGYHRVMGPNGQAQYWAGSFADACALLLRHYELTYVVPGERYPRRRPTADPHGRDVRSSPHHAVTGSPFATVGDVFSPVLNPDRKQPFDMRSVMRAVADADAEPLERWRDLAEGETSIVWDTTIGGIPVCLLGLESHTVPRTGFVPADGPPAWTSGTLFPHSSRKTARAINAASSNRPLVVLANLSGFDGSPESMRRRQLEFGAEIGRAVTNFDGPIVFVVVSRYHGGAFVVFSKALNARMEIAAVEGSFASVIGGAPAAATVFAREVKVRTEQDPRVRQATDAVGAASGPEASAQRALLAQVTAQVRAEKLGEVAGEFDAIHTIERAMRVGSVDRIIAAADLRPYVIDALERGMAHAG